MPASGPVQNPKMFPAAAMEDQEALMAGENPTNVVLSGVPFSSPDPATDAQRMIPLEEGTGGENAAQAREDAAAARSGAGSEDYNSLSPEELDRLVEERDLKVEGSGANGNVLKKDKVAALQADDASDMKAADFKQRISEAQDQEALDEALQLYAGSGKEYASVVAAGEKRQEEINAGNGEQ